MFGLFDTPVCDLCGSPLRRNAYAWQIDGKDRRLCPVCSSRYERRASKAAFEAGQFHADKPQPHRYTALLVFGGLLAVILVISALSRGGSPTHSEAPNVYTPEESTPVPAAPVSPVEAQQSQRDAVRKYPELGRADSPLNALFISRHAAWTASGDPRLNRPDWPEVLAQECHASLSKGISTTNFIGLTESQLRQCLGTPIGVENHISPDGPFKILKYNNTPGHETFFTIFADDGKVMQGYYNGASIGP